MVSSFFLVLLTVVKGFDVDEDPLFLLAECIINFCILVDFVCRVRLTGLKKFKEGGLYNLLDTIVVLLCVVLFIMMFLS